MASGCWWQGELLSRPTRDRLGACTTCWSLKERASFSLVSGLLFPSHPLRTPRGRGEDCCFLLFIAMARLAF